MYFPDYFLITAILTNFQPKHKQSRIYAGYVEDQLELTNTPTINIHQLTTIFIVIHETL